jgi:glycosyltransferase involved in cell wall biosynthesis
VVALREGDGVKIVFVVHYYPPVNSAGAKRVEALSKYFAAAGHQVTVVTTRKSGRDGQLTEPVPPGVQLLEIDALGRLRPSCLGADTYEPLYSIDVSWRRKVKNRVFALLGQLPDPRLPFALSMLSPSLASEVKARFREADVVIGSAPPWPMLLAALFAKWRFGKPCVLDYRDHFSECHEMPGSRLAKWVESKLDRMLVAGADQIVVISEPMATYYRQLGGGVETIMNGFDQALLAAAQAEASPASGKQVLICHMGMISPGRIPHRLLTALCVLKERNPDSFARLRFECYGNASLLQQQLQDSYPALTEAFHFLPALAYRDALIRMVEADYLMFSETSSTSSLSAAGILPTKLFEYIGTGRPVLADIAPAALAGKLLLQYGADSVVSECADDFIAAMSQPEFFQRRAPAPTAGFHPLSREAQAQQYAELIGNLLGHRRQQAAARTPE